MRRSLNILMVNTYQTGGGAGRVGELLAHNLRNTGDRVNALVGANPNRDPHALRAGHWREARVARWLAAHGFPDVGHPTSFLWCCRESYAAADVLHLHNLHGNHLSIAALPLWGRDKPIVWTLHDAWPLTGNCATPGDCTRWRRGCGQCPLRGVYPMTAIDRSRFYRRLKPRLVAAARPLLVAPSRWLAKHVRETSQFAQLPLRVIPNPVDCDLFKPVQNRASFRRDFGLAAEALTIVMVGANWHDPFKGGADAIRALRRAAERVPDLQVLVVGQGSDRLLAASGLGGRAFEFIRARDRLARAYACADVCLFPSRAENYPLTPLEAMACGTPVVAYDVGGVPEQIEHLATGFVAREGEPGELAAGIVEIVRSPTVTRRMGMAGRDFVMRTCAVERVVDEYRRAYWQAIRLWRRRSGRAPRYVQTRLMRWLSNALDWNDPVAPAPTVHTPGPAPQRAVGALSNSDSDAERSGSIRAVVQGNVR